MSKYMHSSRYVCRKGRLYLIYSVKGCCRKSPRKVKRTTIVKSEEYLNTTINVCKKTKTSYTINLPRYKDMHVESNPLYFKINNKHFKRDN